MSIIQWGLSIVGLVVVMAIVKAVIETIGYVIGLELDESQKRAKRLDGR